MSKNQTVVPGEQLAQLFVAHAGGMAEKVLRLVAGENSERYPREFKPWKEGHFGYTARGWVTMPNGERRKVVLIIGQRPPLARQCVELAEMADSRYCFNGKAAVGDRMNLHRMRTAAHELIAAYVVRGKRWADRTNMMHEMPFDCEKPPVRSTSAHEKRRMKLQRRSRGTGLWGGWEQ